MSVWGESPRYIIGAKRQIELAKKYFPDWNIRIYTDSLEKFQDQVNIELCLPYTQAADTFGAFWRFLPLFEEDTIVMVRDADSRFTLREVNCINEWLASDKDFHIIQDHESHYEFPIMGGLFAFKGTFDSNLIETMNTYAEKNSFYLGDQFFLRDYIYPLIHDNILVHSMHEGWFSDTRKNLHNMYSFCGNGYDEHDMPIYPPRFGMNVSNNPKFKFDEGMFA